MGIYNLLNAQQKPPAQGQSWEEWQIQQGLKGQSGSEARAIESRRQAIQKMLKTWKTGYEKSKGQYDFAEQSIRGGAISNVGQLTAGLAGSGMLNTTAAGNAARAANMDMQSQLSQLAQARDQTEYAKWMDLAEIQSNTPYDQMSFNKQEKAGISGGDVLSLIGGLAGISDRRLKKNIRRVGDHPRGIGVYEFSYLWSDERHVGVMADEVAGVLPGAVIDLGGYFAVDYGKL
jgi:hypothetical protein